MVTATAAMTIEQYLHTSFSPDVDFVGGEIQERNLGEKDHGRIQLMVAAWFLAREAVFGLEAVTEQRMLVGPDRARVCDVAVFTVDTPDEQVATIPPLICVDVMSLDDRLSRAIRGLEDYRAMGVRHIWLIDPQEGLTYTFGEGGLKQQEDLVLRVEERGIALDVNDLFSRLHRKKGDLNA